MRVLTPRRLFWSFTAAVAIFLGGFSVLWLTAPVPGVNLAGYNLIDRQMSEADVVAIAGGPPGKYHNRSVAPRLDAKKRFKESYRDIFDTAHHKLWVGDEGDLFVGFTDDGRITYKAFTPAVQGPASFFEKLRGLLGIQDGRVHTSISGGIIGGKYTRATKPDVLGVQRTAVHGSR